MCSSVVCVRCVMGNLVFVYNNVNHTHTHTHAFIHLQHHRHQASTQAHATSPPQPRERAQRRLIREQVSMYVDTHTHTHTLLMRQHTPRSVCSLRSTLLACWAWSPLSLCVRRGCSFCFFKKRVNDKKYGTGSIQTSSLGVEIHFIGVSEYTWASPPSSAAARVLAESVSIALVRSLFIGCSGE